MPQDSDYKLTGEELVRQDIITREELEEVKAHWGFPLHRNMIGHAARILEMIHAWERMVELLALPGGEMMRRTLNPSGGSGEGAVEGPEGLPAARAAGLHEHLVLEADRRQVHSGDGLEPSGHAVQTGIGLTSRAQQAGG